jgi:hypothetical protein
VGLVFRRRGPGRAESGRCSRGGIGAVLAYQVNERITSAKSRLETKHAQFGDFM